MRLPLHIVITTHSQFGREQNVLLFYSLFIIKFTYCMYIIVNKATFRVTDTIKAIIKYNIKLINTTSLSDNKSYQVQWQHISTTMFISYKNIVQYKFTNFNKIFLFFHLFILLLQCNRIFIILYSKKYSFLLNKLKNILTHCQKSDIK